MPLELRLARELEMDLRRIGHPTFGRLVLHAQRESRHTRQLEPVFARNIERLQTAGEIRTRSGRLHEFKTVAEVEAPLQFLIDKYPPLVARLERAPVLTRRGYRPPGGTWVAW